MISAVVMALSLTVVGVEDAKCPDYEQAPYADAYHRCQKSGRPLMVLIGAPWCGACPLAHVFVPRLHKLGEYGYVNYDKDPSFAAQVAGQGGIPRLAVFRRIKDRWSSEVFVGAPEIEKFVKQEEAKTPANPSPTPAPPAPVPNEKK